MDERTNLYDRQMIDGWNGWMGWDGMDGWLDEQTILYYRQMIDGRWMDGSTHLDRQIDYFKSKF